MYSTCNRYVSCINTFKGDEIMIYDRKNNKIFDEKESLGLKILYSNMAGRLILKPFTYKWFTTLGEKYMNSKLSKRKINKFIKKNNINMDEYEKQEYSCFDKFFIV